MRLMIVVSLLGLGAPGGGLCAQELIGAPCEGCEAVLEFGPLELVDVDTLPGFYEASQRMVVRGTIFGPDGTTPASGVVLYIHHTDSSGVYPTRGDEIGWGRRHGYYRGWVKTGDSGAYAFYTVRPGPYPDHSLPAHIHGTIMEPDGRYYWIDEWNFMGDPLLRSEDTDPRTSYGGSGLVRVEENEGLLVVERDIVLGERVPGYR